MQIITPMDIIILLGGIENIHHTEVGEYLDICQNIGGGIGGCPILKVIGINS